MNTELSLFYFVYPSVLFSHSQKVRNLKLECDRIKAKEQKQGGLTEGQQHTIGQVGVMVMVVVVVVTGGF